MFDAVSFFGSSRYISGKHKMVLLPYCNGNKSLNLPVIAVIICNWRDQRRKSIQKKFKNKS